MITNKFLYPIISITAAFLGFMAAKSWHDYHANAVDSAETQALEKKAITVLPEFSLTNREGNQQSIHSWPGKSLIINFWATWCAPCRREVPMLMSLQNKYAGQGFQLVGIAVDFREDVLQFARENKLDYPLLIGEQDGLNAVDAFGIEAVGFPYTVFTDAQGNIITTYIGELHQEQTELILSTVQKINAGELNAQQARSQLTSALSNMKQPSPNEG